MLGDVQEILRRCAREVVLPRRPAPTQARDFVEPWRAEVVTLADTEAEAFIGTALRKLRAFPVVGEESAKADVSLFAHVHGDAPYWLVDPIDGTSAFAAGRACCLRAPTPRSSAALTSPRSSRCAISRPTGGPQAPT